MKGCRFGRYYAPVDCCTHLFDPTPYFSSKGTCFTTNPQMRSYSSPIDTISISINMSSEYSEGINHFKYGPSFAIQAASLTFHSQTHGLAAIDYNSISINRGTAYQIKLSKSKVDRTLLIPELNNGDLPKNKAAACWADGSYADFSQDFGWPGWTKENCEFYVNTLVWPSCSVMQTVGLGSVSWQREEGVLEPRNLTYERKVCSAKDIIESWYQFDANNGSFDERNKNLDRLKRSKKVTSSYRDFVQVAFVICILTAWCHPNCLQASFETTLTSAELDRDDQNLRDVAIVKVSFQTSSTKVFKMIPQTFGEKLCKISNQFLKIF